MAVRRIVLETEELLRKTSRPVEKFDERLWVLLDDMKETMDKANGVGLAAPQVGILRRVVVIDVGEGLYEMINPEIVWTSKETQEDAEGCLSSPGEYGMVVRPYKVRAKYQDRNGKQCTVEAEELFARAICHECDHLDGRLFKDLATEMLEPDEE